MMVARMAVMTVDPKVQRTAERSAVLKAVKWAEWRVGRLVAWLAGLSGLKKVEKRVQSSAERLAESMGEM